MKKVKFFIYLLFLKIFILKKVLCTLLTGVSYFIYTRESGIVCTQTEQNLIIQTLANNNGYQIFQLEISAYSDYYFIKNVLTKTYLQVTKESKRDGQRIILKNKDIVNNDIQLFKLIPVLDGFYIIQNKFTLKYLDMFNKLFTSGNYIHQWTISNSHSQEFFFQEIPKFQINTIYKIFSSGYNLCFNVELGTSVDGLNVMIFEPGTGNNEKFMFESSTVTDYYFIKIMSSNKYLSVRGASLLDGAQIEQATKNTVSFKHQIFKISRDDLGNYYFISKNSLKAITVKDGIFTQGTFLTQNTLIEGSPSQKFELKSP